jgi:hypothetical protein
MYISNRNTIDAARLKTAQKKLWSNAIWIRQVCRITLAMLCRKEKKKVFSLLLCQWHTVIMQEARKICIYAKEDSGG